MWRFFVDLKTVMLAKGVLCSTTLAIERGDIYENIHTDTYKQDTGKHTNKLCIILHTLYDMYQKCIHTILCK